MQIPDAAITAAADVLEAMDGADLATVAEAALAAALPHLLADYRARLVKGSAELGALADKCNSMDNSYFRLCGKQQGLDLARSYLDEITR